MQKHIILRAKSKILPVSKEEKEILKKLNTYIYEIEKFEDIDLYKDKQNIFNAEAIIVVGEFIGEDLIKKFKNLRIISRMGIGVDHIDVNAATKYGVVVANCPNFCVIEVADHIMALLLACNRKLFTWDKLFRRCTQSDDAFNEIEKQIINYPPMRIYGKKLGLVGFGNISRAVCLRAKGFGLELWSYDPFVGEEVFSQYGVKKVGIKDLFRNCDFISISIPYTKDTYHLINKDLFRLMKPNATFINTARGEVVEEKDLIEALKEKWFAGAAVDVFEYIKVYGSDLKKIQSPYFELDNVILTPHIAACSAEALDDVRSQSAENVFKVLNGYWPNNYVNKDVKPKVGLI
jgi:phosphoglycerate dehydrogenase-like enzyme